MANYAVCPNCGGKNTCYEFPELFPKDVKEHCEKSGESLESMADSLRVPFNQFKDWFNGDPGVSLNSLAAN